MVSIFCVGRNFAKLWFMDLFPCFKSAAGKYHVCQAGERGRGRQHQTYRFWPLLPLSTWCQDHPCSWNPIQCGARAGDPSGAVRPKVPRGFSIFGFVSYDVALSRCRKHVSKGLLVDGFIYLKKTETTTESTS